MSILLDLLLLVILIAAFERPVHAYLDPGSGSMLLQLVLGGFAGLVVIAKLYWRRLLALFGIRPRDDR